MFYEKLAESKEDKREGSRGGSIAAMGVGGALGGLAAYLGARKIIYENDGLLTSSKLERERRAAEEAYEGAEKAYDDAKTIIIHQPGGRERARRLADTPDTLYNFGRGSSMDLTRDRREALAFYADAPEGVKAHPEKLTSLYRENEEAGDRLWKSMRRRHAATIGVGTLAGAYGVKKLYDRYNTRKQQEQGS
jgi:hypothetical protein